MRPTNVDMANIDAVERPEFFLIQSLYTTTSMKTLVFPEEQGSKVNPASFPLQINPAPTVFYKIKGPANSFGWRRLVIVFHIHCIDLTAHASLASVQKSSDTPSPAEAGGHFSRTVTSRILEKTGVDDSSSPCSKFATKIAEIYYT